MLCQKVTFFCFLICNRVRQHFSVGFRLIQTNNHNNNQKKFLQQTSLEYKIRVDQVSQWTFYFFGAINFHPDIFTDNTNSFVYCFLHFVSLLFLNLAFTHCRFQSESRNWSVFKLDKFSVQTIETFETFAFFPFFTHTCFLHTFFYFQRDENIFFCSKFFSISLLMHDLFWLHDESVTWKHRFNNFRNQNGRNDNFDLISWKIVMLLFILKVEKKLTWFDIGMNRKWKVEMCHLLILF